MLIYNTLRIGLLRLFFIVEWDFMPYFAKNNLTFMRKILLILSLALLICCPMHSRGEDLKVIAVVEKQKPNTMTNRAPARVQVECFYYTFTSSLELSFLSNLGTVTVSLENQTTGEIHDYVGTSFAGVMIIPVVPNSAYRMDIVTENGRSYFAQFFAGENDSDF